MPKATRKRVPKGSSTGQRIEKSQLPAPNTKSTDNPTSSERDALERKTKELVTSLKYAGRMAKVPVYQL